ncbi:MAG: TolB family protein, partial [Streptosporangiaceae bacterium]
MDLAQLLAITLFRAFDVDAEGRILAGSDASGSTQLIEIRPDGSTVALTALPGACSGSYLPNPEARAGAAERTVIVSHDEGGNERYQLSLLRLPLPGDAPATLADLTPLVHDPRFIHNLADVQASRICYLTNRRDGVSFDPVIRDLETGTEQTLELGDRSYDGAELSPDGRWLALTVASPVLARSSGLMLADLTAPAGSEVTEITDLGERGWNGRPCWLPGSDALIFTSNNGREFTGLVRYELATGQRTWLVTDNGADLTGWLSPDGALLLVERNDDGASVLSLHDAATGALERDLVLPDIGS